MSIIPAKVAGVETVVGCTPPVKGKVYFPTTINAMKKAGADRIFIVGGVPAFAMIALHLEIRVKDTDYLLQILRRYPPDQ